jgi:hypothetical protein
VEIFCNYLTKFECLCKICQQADIFHTATQIMQIQQPQDYSEIFFGLDLNEYHTLDPDFNKNSTF